MVQKGMFVMISILDEAKDPVLGSPEEPAMFVCKVE